MKAEIFLFDMETKKDNFISLSVKMSDVILYLAALSKCHIIFNCIICWILSFTSIGLYHFVFLLRDVKTLVVEMLQAAKSQSN